MHPVSKTSYYFSVSIAIDLLKVTINKPGVDDFC
jgi:hypothetical protein